MIESRGTTYKVWEAKEGMEAQRPPCPTLHDQPTQFASCLKVVPAASSLSANPVILQPDQVVSQTVYLKALTIPHYPPIQSDHLQPNYRLLPGQTSITLESTHLPLILNPLLQSDVMDHLQTVVQKQPGTISIVSGLPVSPANYSPCPPLGSPSKCKNVGKYICKQCGRDCLKPSVLEKHMRSHTGERPFPCTTCGIAFKTQSNLYKHKRTQTHVNNARLSLELDSNNLVEESEKLTKSIASTQKTKANDKNCDHQRATVKHTSLVTNEKHSLDTSSPAANTVFLVSESHWMTIDHSYHGGTDQSVIEKETVNDSANPLQRRKFQEQRSLTISKPSQLQRQQATYSEKLWDNRSPDYKLKKCESTDSGYFSRSDSVEQQMLSPSPLHSLCEHVTETGDITFNNLKCAAENVSKMDAPEKARENLTLEKKKLEEHISKLISHNKAVVDDTQLENVRPRKTILSKQGSIDLPMPYTYRDSFHFDIRSLDINRRKLSLCSAKSTFTPVEKSKPLIFHSVPTQFSTTIDAVPVTRSNSMPFIESTRRVQDHVDILKVSSATTSPDTGLSGLLDGKNLSNVIDFPASHHRALVRQAAVDDLPLSNVNESLLEEIQNARKLASGGERTSTKYKKSSQRKSKMFSQEKWQVYGDETFKKIYQKMKSSQTSKKPKGNRETDMSTLLSVGKGMFSCDGILLPNDGRNSTDGNLLSSTSDVTAKLNTEESGGYSASTPVSQDACSHESSGSSAEFMETYAVSDTQHGEISKTFVAHRCTELLVSKQDLSSNSQVVPISTSCESSFQLQQPMGQKTNTHSNIASLHNSVLEEHTQEEFIKCVPLHEAISRNKGDVSVEKEGFQLSQEVSLSNQCHFEPGQEPQIVPSERKKLKVEKLNSNKNTAFKSNLHTRTSTERIVKLLDYHKIDVVPAESVNNSVTGEKQKVVVGRNKSWGSRDCEETLPNSIMTSSNSSNKDYFANITETTTMSVLEQHKSEVANKYGCNLCALQSLTKQSCPMITGTVVSSKTGDRAQTPTSSQHLIFDEVTPCLKKNSFLPKYILKCSQEIVSPGMPLILAESEKMSCISLSSTSHSTSVPASSNRLVRTNATDVLLCPLQLEMSHPIKTKESKWDMQRVWKPLVVCPTTTVLETTRIDRRYHLQNITQKETVKDVRSAHNRDSSGDGRLTEEVDGHTVVCTSLTLGKKICFTTVYAGGIFISSDKTGQSSALQLMHSKNSSVISLSSLVERTVLCGDTEKIKEWQSGSHSFSRPQELSTSSLSKPECLCHSSSMLYCHVLCPQEKEVNIPSQFSAISQAGNSKVPYMNVSFPTLNAEPQLTWCCLSRNLPLPVEQKGKKDSAYSSLYVCKNEDIISKYGHSFCKMENTGKVASGKKKTGALKISVPLFPEELQKEELYPSAAGVDGLFKNATEPAEAKIQLHKMRESSGNKSKRSHKRKNMKMSQKHYKKKYGHRCSLLKNKQRNKQQWPTTRGLETPSSHSPNSHEQHCIKCLCFPTASQGNGETLQKTYVINEKAASPVKHKMKDFPSCTSEHGNGGLFLHEISTVPNEPVLNHSCPLASNAPAQKANHLDICSLGTVKKKEQPNVNSDHHWPSVGTCNFELIDTNKSCPCNIMNLQVTVNSKANFERVESKHQHFTVLQPSVSVKGREQSTEKDLKNQHTSSIQTPRMLTETSISNKTLPRSRYVQETKSVPLSCTDRNTKSMKLDSSHGEFSKPGFSVFKTPSAYVARSEALCKSSRYMEMADKQTHVEYDNISSSDDEDRLIIEI